ncbi:Hypothetical protein NTJ_04167 [Nesidiocoris tenuis]|uniref:Uncharacterized protein n=1 Tax=Nesidiocoris tenuis TaxID=355587 RepID=A0ABN7AGK3_9HEMI|nr:Hypothetical protein NTJ_04167 [Nesidiocoris tenuis]
MRNSGVGISRDMSPLARDRCNRMLKLRWVLRNCYPNLDLNMRLHYDKLQINGRVFEWDAEDLVDRPQMQIRLEQVEGKHC